ncbi:hypothetical protein LguiA_010612 [Lonicera macranthoides]
MTLRSPPLDVGPQYLRLHGRYHRLDRQVSIPSVPQQYLSCLSWREGPTGPYTTFCHVKQDMRLHTQIILHKCLESMHPART